MGLNWNPVPTATPTRPHSQTTASSRNPDRRYNPLARWHLLSLDAPTVAALWTWFIAASNQIHLPLTSALAMALAVWALYAADRLLDARLLDASLMDTRLMDARTLDTQPHLFQNLEARHYFHHRNRTFFLTGIVLASITLAFLLPHLDADAIRLYLILGSLVCGYFILIHATQSAHRLPKEIAVGIFFAAATFIPTVARRPDLRLTLLPPALLFATLCSLNCLYIYAWEHKHHRRDLRLHPITGFALRHLSLLTTALIAASTAIALLGWNSRDQQSPWPIPCAIAIAAILLQLLNRRRQTLDPITLRAAADLALLTPVLLLPFLPR